MPSNLDLRQWDGEESFKGKHVVIVGEGGFGDMIMWGRYLPFIRRVVGKLTLDIPKTLHRLFADMADDFIDGGDRPVGADFFVYSMEIPFLFREKAANSAYLKVEPLDLPDFRDDLKVGIAWEGDPNHTNNDERCVPLKFFRCLEDVPGIKFFTLVPFIHQPELTEGCTDMDLYGSGAEDFYDTAQLIQAMDVVVTVDTAVAHLAAALGKKTYCLVSKNYDHRWDVQDWYNALTLVPQEFEGDWMTPMQIVRSKLCKMRGVKGLFFRNQPPPVDILYTGGLGDIITLESHMDDDYLARVNSVYYASRVYPTVTSLYGSIPEFTNIKQHGFTDIKPADGFAFYNKREVASALGERKPANWREVLDWSINTRFPHIEKGRHPYRGSRLLKHHLCAMRKPLPDRFVIIHPSSANRFQFAEQSFDFRDWEMTVALLEALECDGVVVNDLAGLYHGNAPEHPRIINMAGQTSLAESVEILKLAMGYVGIDSWLSVLAAQKFPTHRLQIKQLNSHGEKCKAIYFAPHKTFPFLVDSIKPAFPS